MGTRLSRTADKLAAALAPAFEAGDAELAKRTLRECCTATRRVRQRNPDGDLIYVDVPDAPVRLAAAVKILEWSIGKPVARSINANINAPAAAPDASSADDLLGLLLASPDAAADIVSKLQQAAAKAKPIVDVTPRRKLEP